MSSRLSRKKLAARLLGYVQSGGSAQKVAAYLISERRTKDLNGLERDLMQLRTEDGVLEMTATTAHALTPDLRSKITDIFPANKHILHEKLAPEVLGGIKVETVDKQLDLTAANRIQKLKNLSPGGNRL